MKTLVFRSFDNSLRAEVQVDIFATNAQLQDPAFETRFTNMEIGPGYKDDVNMIQSLGQLQEVEKGWQAIVDLAKNTAGIGLFVIDNGSPVDSTKNAQSDSEALSGTSGTMDLKINGVDYSVTFNTNLATTADDFVTTHAAALSAAGITVTHTTADGVLLFVADVAGVGYSVEVNLAEAIDTVTLTGTSGTANVVIDGTNYLATFDTDLTTTAANFVTLHAADILYNHNIVVTSAIADIKLTKQVGGVTIASSVANVSGDLAGSSADTVDPGDINATRTSIALNQSGNGEITIVAP